MIGSRCWILGSRISQVPLMKTLDNNKWVIFNSELKNNQSSSDRLCVYLSILRIGIRNKKWLDVINVG